MRVAIDWNEGHDAPPSHDRWLTGPERADLSAWRGARREDSRRARWLLKRLAGAESCQISGSGPKRVTHPSSGESLPASISHTDGVVAAALADRASELVGCDVVKTTPLSPAFLKTWMTQDEQAWIAQTGNPAAGAIVWAFKEAFYKTGLYGESFQPAKIDILRELRLLELPTPQLDSSEERAIADKGLWRLTSRDDYFVLTIALSPYLENTFSRPAA